jgi:hypothetical protein
MTDLEHQLPSELDQLPDRDPEETAEWGASLDAVARAAGPHRASYLLRRTLQHAERAGIAVPPLLESPYVNSIPTAAEPAYPGDLELEGRITAWNRWNAAAMVTRGSRDASAGTSPRTPRSPGSTRPVSSTSSVARTRRAPRGRATSCSSRATPPPASTPAPSSKAG